MAKVNMDMLISILKYIDINYMTDDEGNGIYLLDINDEENQKEIIRKLIVPGIKSDYSEETFDRAKEVLLMGINNIEASMKIFQQMSFPFESDMKDKRGFLKKIYQELFERKEL